VSAKFFVDNLKLSKAAQWQSAKHPFQRVSFLSRRWALQLTRQMLRNTQWSQGRTESKLSWPKSVGLCMGNHVGTWPA